MDLRSLVNINEIEDDVLNLLSDPLSKIPTIEESLEISKKYGVSLHPRYIYYWSEIKSSELIVFLEYLKRGTVDNGEFKIGSLNKEFFEKLGVEHRVENLLINEIKNEEETSLLVIDELNTKILFSNLGIYKISTEELRKRIDVIIEFASENLSKSCCKILSTLNDYDIRNKGGTYIGARMGRPEKAKVRKLDGRPHGLFPVGEEGGRLRNIMEAYEKKGFVNSDFAIFKGLEDNNEYVYPVDFKGNKNKISHFERYGDREVSENNEKAVRYKKTSVELDRYINNVREIIGSVELPKLVKGIRGTSNKHHVVEHLVKSFLREKNGVYVNKDGTIRYDMIEMGITHFKPSEIGVDFTKLIELGYEVDMNGDEIKSNEQIIEIFPQDVILPDCKESGDELASEFVLNTGRFVDELLKKLYGIEPFYNFKSKEDTIGHLIIGLAPHTSAGIIGRIIGYSKTQGCFSHPVWHAAQRRNLDGDENGIMLLMDGLVNFSREYLPDRRGSRTMDTSLVLTSHLYLDQVDDEVHGMDVEGYYPLEFYEKAKKYGSAKDIKVQTIGRKMGLKNVDKRYFGYKFTHGTNDMNDTIMCSSYKSLPTMKEKMDLQLGIGSKIRAVDENQVGSFIIDKHFMKDIKGNLRKFSMQSFRCTKCNTIFRRPPLVGKCTSCGEPSVNFTISEGSIKKYLDPSFEIVRKYDVDPYIVETLELVNLRIEGVFGKEVESQKSLNSFFGK